ncbi:MAG: hypothetical protein RMI04_08575, partial [Thermofilaceae archaeon]|nr:hypothetical protein [Thermofilaceae archaeon]
KPNRMSPLAIQTTHKTILQLNNSQPEKQPTPKMGKNCGMLKPNLQNIHILLQPLEEVSLKLPCPLPISPYANCNALFKLKLILTSYAVILRAITLLAMIKRILACHNGVSGFFNASTAPGCFSIHFFNFFNHFME